jgi:flotillin
MTSFAADVMLWMMPVIIIFALFILVIKQYKICPNDKLLCIYGAGSSASAGARIVHGGGALVIPFLQNFRYMSLAPMSITVDLQNALSANNIRLSLPSQFTIAIASKTPELIQNAVRNLLDMDEAGIERTASNIIIGALRAVVGKLTIDELIRDRVAFIKAINDDVNSELNKIGLDLVNVNIRDIQDSSGYIEAMGKKAASEAVNKAQVDVSEQDRIGQTGVETNNRERDVTVAEQKTKASIGISTADRDRNIKQAELSAETQKGKNTAAATVADSNADLAVREAKAFQTGEVARAQAQAVVANEQRTATQAELAKEQLPAAEVAKEQLVIESSATAEKARLIAKGEADAILLRFEAEAKGVQLVLEAKATGYKKIIEAAGGNAQAAANLMMIEKMAEIVKIQSEAIANIKIDSVVVWDSGNGSDGGVQGFVKNLVAALPPLQEIAAQVGFQLPEFMGSLIPKEPKAKETPALDHESEADSAKV